MRIEAGDDVGTIFTVHAGAVGRLDTFLVSKAQTVHGGISVLAEISSKLGRGPIGLGRVTHANWRRHHGSPRGNPDESL